MSDPLESRRAGSQMVELQPIERRGPDVQQVDRRVLAILAGLVAELGGSQARQPALADRLDQDLGIGSLERVELLIRLETAFGVRLHDSVVAEASSGRDLVAAVARAAPRETDGAPASVETPASVNQGRGFPPSSNNQGRGFPPRSGEEPGTCEPAARAAISLPSSARTLVEALRWHAERTPHRVHIRLVLDDGTPGDDGTSEPITYENLLTRAAATAAGLRAIGVGVGDRVALMLRTERAFFPAFYGALLAGAVPVPIYPPFRPDQLADYARRQRAILRNAGARVLVTFDEAQAIAPFLRASVPSLEQVITVERLAGSAADAAAFLDGGARGGHETALIQYTSGSTGDPKGVVLTHANLLANLRAIGEAIGIGGDDACVSWLPLYHDMGLIGAWLGALYFGIPVALLSPQAFLARPSRWLRTIASFHGTLSPAPNFAFELCARKVADAEIQGLDLSTWRLALNGSEPVGPETLARFTRRFEPYGFRPEAMCPVYGLAECSVGLTASPVGRLPRIDTVEREAFDRSRELRSEAPVEGSHAGDSRAGGSQPLQFVSCGRPLPGHDVRIVDASGVLLSERVEGHIQFRGPSVTRGYFENPAATEAVLHDGWMDSGDLGYWAAGELYITGREKDLIIQAGHNVCPQEIEELAGAVPGIRKGCVAAFGIPDPATGTERLVVVAETRETDPDRRRALQQALLSRVAAAAGIAPHAVTIAGPGTVLKTSSGKIRRREVRQQYLLGALGARRPSAFRQWAGLSLAAYGDRAQRIIDRMRRMVFTAYAGAMMIVTLPLLSLYLRFRPPGPHAGRAAARWSRMALAVCGFPLRVSGLEHLSGISSGILAANHASYIDPVVLMAALPLTYRFRFAAKRGLVAYPVIGTVIRRAGHVMVERSSVADRLAGAEQMAARLRRGERLLVFPEGTFVRAPGLLPFRLGAFKAAVEANRPIVPVAIRGTRQVLPDGAWLLRRGPIDVTIGAPLHPQAQDWREMVRLRNAARDAIARECGEAS